MSKSERPPLTRFELLVFLGLSNLDSETIARVRRLPKAKQLELERRLRIPIAVIVTAMILATIMAGVRLTTPQVHLSALPFVTSIPTPPDSEVESLSAPLIAAAPSNALGATPIAASAPAQPSPEPSSPAGVYEYTIMSGDTLWAIVSEHYHTSNPQSIQAGIDEVLKVNPGLSPDRLRPGDKIKLPRLTRKNGVAVLHRKS